MTLGEFFTLLGFLTGAVVLLWAARQKKLATEGMALVAAAGFVGGMIGAKVTQFAFEGLAAGLPWWSIFDPRMGGRALLGGLVAGWLSVIAAKKYLGITRPTGDLFALALPAGEAVGRIGCYFNGCCYGTRCEFPWAVDQHGALRHPAQLYTAITAAAIFLVLLRKRKALKVEGDLFKLYLLLFGATRFGLEFVRENNSFWLSLTPMQWFCLELVAYSLVSTFWRRRIGTAARA